MQRDRQHRRVVEEDLLGPVAVVHVPVDDRHALQAALALRPARRDRRVVEQAEAHRGLALGMVPGRAQQRERVVDRPVEHRVDGGEQAAGGQQHRVVRARAGPGVAAELDGLRALRGREHARHVRVGVREAQLVRGRRARLELAHPVQRAASLEHAPRQAQALRALERLDRRPLRQRPEGDAAGRVDMGQAARVVDDAGPALGHLRALAGQREPGGSLGAGCCGAGSGRRCRGRSA